MLQVKSGPLKRLMLQQMLCECDHHADRRGGDRYLRGEHAAPASEAGHVIEKGPAMRTVQSAPAAMAQPEPNQPWIPPNSTLTLSATRSPPTPHQATRQAYEDGKSASDSPASILAAGFPSAADGGRNGLPPSRRRSVLTWSLAEEHEQLQRAESQGYTPRWRGRGSRDGKEANASGARGGSAGLPDGGTAPPPSPGSEFEVETFLNSLQASMGRKWPVGEAQGGCPGNADCAGRHQSHDICSGTMACPVQAVPCHSEGSIWRLTAWLEQVKSFRLAPAGAVCPKQNPQFGCAPLPAVHRQGGELLEGTGRGGGQGERLAHAPELATPSACNSERRCKPLSWWQPEPTAPPPAVLSEPGSFQSRWWGCLGRPCAWLGGRLGGWLGGLRRKWRQPSWQAGEEEASDLEQQAQGEEQPKEWQGQRQERFKAPEQQHRPTAEEEEELQWRELAGERGPPDSEPARLQEEAEGEVEEQQLGVPYAQPSRGAEQKRGVRHGKQRGKRPGKPTVGAGRPVCRSLLGLPILRPDSVWVKAWDGFMSLLDLTYTGGVFHVASSGAVGQTLNTQKQASTLSRSHFKRSLPNTAAVASPLQLLHGGGRANQPCCARCGATGQQHASHGLKAALRACLCSPIHFSLPPCFPAPLPALQPTWCPCRWPLTTCRAPPSLGSTASTSQAVSPARLPPSLAAVQPCHVPRYSPACPSAPVQPPCTAQEV